MTSLLAGIRKIAITSLLTNSLWLLPLCLFTLTASANPVITKNTDDIVFDESCPNGEQVCSGHILDCLGGCAFNATTKETLFTWERTIVEETADAERLFIQAQKSCLNRDKIRAALLKALETTPDNDQEQSLCLEKGPTWQLMHAQFSISSLSSDTCNTAKPLLWQLANSCQSYKKVASYSAKALGIALGSIVGAACVGGVSYFIYRKCHERKRNSNSLRAPFARYFP